MQRTFATIGTWPQMTGIGRATTYGLLANGKLHAVKADSRTLIDVYRGLAWFRPQSTAKISIKRTALHPGVAEGAYQALALEPQL